MTTHTGPLSPVGLHYPTDHNPPIVPFPKPVVRWDIFDIADELADLPGLVKQGVDDPRVLLEVHDTLLRLEKLLWDASRIAGKVGCYPDYKQEV
jgi:hypothetical protein